MAALRLDGQKIALQVKSELAEKVRVRLEQGHRPPHLVAVLVGEDGASESYVQFKVKDCQDIGYTSTLLRYPTSISQQALLSVIHELNAREDVDGFIVQLPLPKHIEESAILLAIRPSKDVDGFHPENAGRLMAGLPCFVAATPWGISKLLTAYGITVEGKHCVIIGRSHIVGTPLSILLSRATPQGNATVTLAHSRTNNLEDMAKQADILIVATGRPGMVSAAMVKEGAVVIDVGTTRVKDTSSPRGWRLVGDVLADEIAEKASFLTPVPGGVGPMTRVGLLWNTFEAYAHTIYP
jgi:methylenetetrahydrofolate dehydrogenase (NADP+)/methenyltetrahydrofolate cyclohydrolase